MAVHSATATASLGQRLTKDLTMAQPLVDRVLHDARTIIADRGRRLRHIEAVGADGNECDPCSDEARRFSAPWAL